MDKTTEKVEGEENSVGEVDSLKLENDTLRNELKNAGEKIAGLEKAIVEKDGEIESVRQSLEESGNVLEETRSSLTGAAAAYKDLVAQGACGYAAIELAVYSINRVNVGGSITPGELLEWGNQKLKHFRKELKRLGRRNRVSVNTLYEPYSSNIAATTD